MKTGEEKGEGGGKVTKGGRHEHKRSCVEAERKNDLIRGCVMDTACPCGQKNDRVSCKR